MDIRNDAHKPERTIVAVLNSRHTNSREDQLKKMASNNQSSTPSSSSEEVVWYFAFGSNMASRVLIGRRQVQPMESHPCVVEGYDLVFNMRGLPFFEVCC